MEIMGFSRISIIPIVLYTIVYYFYYTLEKKRKRKNIEEKATWKLKE